MPSASSTPNEITAKLGLHGVLDSEVVKTLTVTYNGLLNNPAFPNTPVDLAVYKAGIDSFAALVVDAEDGGTKAIKAKDKQRVEVIRMYTLLGHYVEAACNDDVATFNTSSFTAVSTVRANTPQPLGNASIKWVDRGANSGQVLVRVAPLTGAVSYELRYGLVGNGGAPPATWTSLPLAGTKTVTLNNLTAGADYAFQVRALGKLGYSDWSDSVTFICA